MIHTFIAERCSDLPVSVCCRLMEVSTSGFYQRRNDPVTDAKLAEAHCANTVFDIWKMSRHSFGMPGVRHEPRLGRGEGCSRTTTARLVGHLRGGRDSLPPARGCTRSGDGDVSDDLVNRAFDPEGPDRLWCMDITEHRTETGKVYLAVVIDAWSRRVVGWSIADHIRAELVADAVHMATWRRRPPPGQVIAHSDHGGQYTSWLFGSRLRQRRPARLDGHRRRLLRQLRGRGLLLGPATRAARPTPLAHREQLALAIFDWIECWYNPRRRHSYNHGLSPTDYETAPAA